MKRYIDAEPLKEVLKELESVIYSKQLVGQSMRQYDNGQLHAIKFIKELIDSLQQEQSCDTCTNDKGCVTCKDGELWEGKPVEDLEKEIKTWIPAHIVGGDEAPWKELKDVVIQWSEVVARHFYILGLKNNIPVTQITLEELAKEGEPVSKDLEKEIQRYLREECSSDDEPSIGEIARHFANWQKEQILKDSVEASVNYYENIPGGSYVELVADILNPTGIRYKDKVKIIIVKEDKK